jgi:hypothetical protein
MQHGINDTDCTNDLEDMVYDPHPVSSMNIPIPETCLVFEVNLQ